MGNYGKSMKSTINGRFQLGISSINEDFPLPRLPEGINNRTQNQTTRIQDFALENKQGLLTHEIFINKAMFLLVNLLQSSITPKTKKRGGFGLCSRNESWILLFCNVIEQLPAHGRPFGIMVCDFGFTYISLHIIFIIICLHLGWRNTLDIVTGA